MKFVVIFKDASDADPGIRQQFMKEHLAFLSSSGVCAAGPLTDSEGKGRDGLWIVEAPDSSHVEQLVRTDPFWPTGLRESYDIISWKQVYADGQILV